MTSDIENDVGERPEITGNDEGRPMLREYQQVDMYSDERVEFTNGIFTRAYRVARAINRSCPLAVDTRTCSCGTHGRPRR